MKRIKIILVLLFFLIFIYSSKETLSYINTRTLYYDGNTNKFTYINSNNTELFSSFKDLMPGDTREESILFKGDNIKDGSILYIYMPESEILDYITVNVYENDKLLVTNPSDEEILKKLNKHEEFKIKMELKVDEEATNEIEGATKNLGIAFLIKNDKGETINPQTSDNFKLYLYVGIMIISIIGIILVIILKRKKKD